MTTATQTIPKGYKQTEIGVIPVDWDMNNLGDFVQIRSGESPSKFIMSKTGIPYFKVDQLNNSAKYQKETPYFVDVTNPVKAKSLVFPKRGAAIYQDKIRILAQDSYMDTNLMTLTVDAKLDNEFLFYYLLNRGLSHIADTTSVPQINNKHIIPFKIIYPKSKLEQTAIATVLSDTDALIEKLEKLIVKKKAVKQGAMQQLLTGKKRLPGFSGEWEVKKLKEISWYQEGPGVRTSQFTQSGVKLLNGTNIFMGKIDLNTTDRYISEKEAYGPYSHFMADEEDIVIASSGITIDKFEEKIAFVIKRNLPFCMNTSTIRFKVDKDLLVDRFFYFFLMTTKFKKQIGAQATGSAQLNFGPSHLDKVIVDVPESKEEQTVIATVLSDMDAEIEGMEKSLKKYRQIKTGMMQQLLTGKIRLVKN